MSNFPKVYYFKRYMQRKTQVKIMNIIEHVESSESKEDFKKKISELTKREIKLIEMRTRGQSRNELWFHYRRGVITATLSRRISHAIKKGGGERNVKINAAITKLQRKQLWFPAITWGRLNEQNGINEFLKKFKRKHYDVSIIQPGLLLYETCPFIGGSADALVTCSCCGRFILEVKCPYSLRNQNPIIDGHKLPYLSDDLKLRKNHVYFSQIQTYLALFGISKAFLAVWTPLETLIVEVDADKTYWDKLKDDMVKYYYNNYLQF